MEYKIKEGDYAKLGIEIKRDGVIFTFEGEREDQCALLLHDEITGQDQMVEVPKEYCIGALRSIYILGIDVDHIGYLFVKNGEAFMDPYAYAVMGRDNYHDDSRKKNDYRVYGRLFMPKKPVKPMHGLEIPKGDMFLYKLHVRGFTKDKGASSSNCGTFAGLMTKIPYLKSLGVTSVELMPCYEYEEFQISRLPAMPYSKREASLVCKKQINYWGYTSGQYFAVKASYAKNPKKAGDEFAKLVAKLHDAGIECIMEMYFTEETNQNLIIEALQFWVEYYHVDGFRLVGRNIPVVAIMHNSYLARTKLFYEEYPEDGLTKERKYKRLYIDKDEYLYSARQILNHINGNMINFSNQQKKQSHEFGFINYLASNNGFTYMDTLMYNDRHNEANGEDNYDGNPCNFSHNYGVEGPSKKKMVSSLRKRQWKNGMAMLFLAQGVPMLLQGDEFGNSKSGNNNSYCQDNEIGWVNWKQAKTHGEEIQFVKDLVTIRRKYGVLAKEDPFTFSDTKSVGIPDLSYHGKNAWITGISGDMFAIGMLYSGSYGKEQGADVYVAYNFYASEAELAIPRISKNKWKLLMKTGEAEIVDNQKMIKMDGHSICVLVNEE